MLPVFGELLEYFNGSRVAIALDANGTEFQRRVWTALRSIPYGSTRSYEEVAESLGNARAYRAVARACATNPVSLLIPCHRVLRKDGSLGGYRWGLERKRALIMREKGVRSQSELTALNAQRNTRAHRVFP